MFYTLKSIRCNIENRRDLFCFSAIKVGHSGQSQEEVVENIVAVVDEIAKKVPRGWSNIQCIHLKTAESVALPLYNSLPDVENVIEKNEPPKKKKKLD